MKFVYVSDYWFCLGPDGKWYSGFDYMVKYILRQLPEVTNLLSVVDFVAKFY